MSKLVKIPDSLLIIYIQFLGLKKYDVEYYGSIYYPVICVGDATSCPAYATNWLAQNAKKNSFFHSHPYTLKRRKAYLKEIEYISPADILFFLNYHNSRTYLFSQKCVWQFDIPKSLKYDQIKDVVDDLLDEEERRARSKNKKIIVFPMSNKEFCKKLGITRRPLLTKAQAIKMWKKKRKSYIDPDE